VLAFDEEPPVLVLNFFKDESISSSGSQRKMELWAQLRQTLDI
jgi:hypothetical protein